MVLRMYVGAYHHGLRSGDALWFEKFAMLELGTPEETTRLAAMGESDDTHCPAVYAHLTDEVTVEFDDCTGKTLRALPLDQVLSAAQIDATSENSRRACIAADLLAAFKSKYPQPSIPCLCVLLYWH
jgi:hypothetical protein